MRKTYGILLAVLVFTAHASAQERIRVHVVPPAAAADGFVDDTLKGQQDSFADLTERLRKSKTVEVVDASAVADVTIEIRGRGWKETGETSTKTIALPPIAGGGFSSRTSADGELQVAIVLRAGAYEKELSARGDHAIRPWKAIADRLAGGIEKWVKENRATLLARRGQ